MSFLKSVSDCTSHQPWLACSKHSRTLTGPDMPAGDWRILCLCITAGGRWWKEVDCGVEHSSPVEVLGVECWTVFIELNRTDESGMLTRSPVLLRT